MESVKSIPVKVGDAFTIADYGCADGGTSMPLMYACIKELRTLYGNELEVHINYEDKPENDFKSLFYFLQGKEKAMKQNNKLMVSSLQPPASSPAISPKIQEIHRTNSCATAASLTQNKKNSGLIFKCNSIIFFVCRFTSSSIQLPH